MGTGSGFLLPVSPYFLPGEAILNERCMCIINAFSDPILNETDHQTTAVHDLAVFQTFNPKKVATHYFYFKKIHLKLIADSTPQKLPSYSFSLL